MQVPVQYFSLFSLNVLLKRVPDLLLLEADKHESQTWIANQIKIASSAN
jgi:hypothetical protein